MAQGTELGYELRHPVRDYATYVVRTGRPGVEFPTSVMEPFTTAQLSDAELGLIFDYLDSFPDPTTAQERYGDYCANCHGMDGRGGPTMRPIATEPDSRFMLLVRAGHGGTNFAARRDYMPRFNSTWLSDAEIAEIGAYVRGL